MFLFFQTCCVTKGDNPWLANNPNKGGGTYLYGNITDIPGIKVGHFSDPVALTGCTVVLAETGVVGGVDVRGQLLVPGKPICSVRCI